MATPRRSARSPAAALASLATLIASRRPILLITGAGVSAASGIPTFRSGASAIWDERTVRYGTRESFSRDPLHWYNAFWLAGVIPWAPFYAARPNPAHTAIAALTAGYNVNVVTQNIDLLHRTGDGAIADDRLVLAHGRADTYICDRLGLGCTASEDVVVDLWDCAASDGSHQPTAAGDTVVPPTSLARVPRCERCGEGAMRPACLMFDEDYDLEKVWLRYQAWASEAAAVVFVGSSNAVGLTTDALRMARKKQLPVYSFNINRKCMKSAPRSILVHHVLGPAEETVPKLLDSVLKAIV